MNLLTTRFETVNSVDMSVDPYAHDWSPKGPCVKCGVRKATSWFVAEGGALAFVHGCGQAWCGPCCTQAAIEHAEEMAAKLPGLQRDMERMKLLEILARRVDTET
jgi:hypothetical protein